MRYSYNGLSTCISDNYAVTYIILLPKFWNKSIGEPLTCPSTI